MKVTARGTAELYPPSWKYGVVGELMVEVEIEVEDSMSQWGAANRAYEAIWKRLDSAGLTPYIQYYRSGEPRIEIKLIDFPQERKKNWYDAEYLVTWLFDQLASSPLDSDPDPVNYLDLGGEWDSDDLGQTVAAMGYSPVDGLSLVEFLAHLLVHGEVADPTGS